MKIVWSIILVSFFIAEDTYARNLYDNRDYRNRWTAPDSSNNWVFKYSPESCQTAQPGIRGQCIRIYECPVLLAAFNEVPIPQRLVNFLRRSQCGFERNVPKVCCSNRLNLEEVEYQQKPTEQRHRPTSNQYNQADNYYDQFPTNCGVQSNGDRIYNGQITDIDEFPWMCLIGFRTSKGTMAYECGGVLISKRYVLTAGHCVVGEVNSKVGRLSTVRLGEYNLDTDPDCVSAGEYEDCNDNLVEIPVEKAIAHPGFSDQNVNRKDDIALLRLSREVQFTDFIRPICLPRGPTHLRQGEPVVVAGWGKTLTSKHSQVKLKLQIPVYDSNQCYNKYAAYRAYLTNKQMCAGGEYERDACFGDSGGPLMRADARNVWTTVGIVSFGNGCGKSGWPGVYTEVGDYLPWIKENVLP